MMTMYISPYRRMVHLRDAMGRLMDETFSENTPTEREMTLAVDVRSDDEGFVIQAMVPGLEADDLTIEILSDNVTIRGEFKSCASDEAHYLACELPQGRFSRSLTLPVAVDSTKAEANIKNGVLTLHLPKAEAHRPKAIKVTTA